MWSLCVITLVMISQGQKELLPLHFKVASKKRKIRITLLYFGIPTIRVTINRMRTR